MTIREAADFGGRLQASTRGSRMRKGRAFVILAVKRRWVWSWVRVACLAFGVSAPGALFGFSRASDDPPEAPAARSYCVYEVTVRSYDGKPMAGVAVEIVRDGWGIAHSSTDALGRARFCDAPMGRVDFAIGGTRCGGVLVKGVQHSYPNPKRVEAVFQDDFCQDWVFPEDCLVLIRAHAPDGLPIRAGVGLRRTGGELVRADELGRIFVRLTGGEEIRGVISAHGFEAAPVAAGCRRGSVAVVEVSPELRPTPPRRP